MGRCQGAGLAECSVPLENMWRMVSKSVVAWRRFSATFSPSLDRENPCMTQTTPNFGNTHWNVGEVVENANDEAICSDFVLASRVVSLVPRLCQAHAQVSLPQNGFAEDAGSKGFKGGSGNGWMNERMKCTATAEKH